MPKEVRKRGKKHKKPQNQAFSEPEPAEERENHGENFSKPSWIVSLEPADVNPEAPFGYVDPDVKAYFRSVDEQIQSWQEDGVRAVDDDGDFDPNEARRVFFVAALGEMSGKEKQLATDPHCSVILERMAYSMDDFVLRVFIDRLSGSFEVLFKHRFASHVCQTLLSVAADTISREVKNIFPEVPASESDGELRTLTQLVLDICDEIVPSFNSLIMGPFASHVLRALLLLLCPTVLPEDSARKHLRSKKSRSWKAKQGHMKSVFFDDKGKEALASSNSVPGSFRSAADRFLRIVRDGLDANETRALAANKFASPLLQLLLEIEADHGSASTHDSLMDRVLVGMIKAYHEDRNASTEPSDYLVTLLRDATSSRLLEISMSRCPEQVFDALWSVYFRGKLTRLALHPVANFVVAKAVARLDNKQLDDVFEELESSWSKLISSSRTGVLRALIDRSRCFRGRQKDVCEAVISSVEISSSDDRKHLVPCLLQLKPLNEYRATLVLKVRSSVDHKKRGRDGQVEDQNEPKAQGVAILESLLRIDEPHCSIVVDSISSLCTEDFIRMAHNPRSSWVIDTLFESPTVSFKAKRRFIMSLIGNYHTLVDDRVGSRVGDRCWAFADTYLREKIARSLIPHEQLLAASFYGKFFTRNVNLYMLVRRPEEWRALQSKLKSNNSLNSDQPSVRAPVQSQPNPPPSKRRDAPEDEIDAVFKVTLGNKTKRAAIGRVSAHEGEPSRDNQISEVMGAIREAPSGESRRKKKRKVG